jgi:hypothetical protein
MDLQVLLCVFFFHLPFIIILYSYFSGLFDFIVNTFEAINFKTLTNVHVYEFCFNSTDLQSLPLEKFPWAANTQAKHVGKSQLASSIKHTKLYPDSSGYWKISRDEQVGFIISSYKSQTEF